MGQISSSERMTFRDVKQDIIQRITNGPWGPGTLLPSEIDLAFEFGCSRTTMNRALREVSEQGLLERKRKAGTRVREFPLRQARFAMPLIRTEIEQTGATYRYSLLQREIVAAPSWLRARMNLSAEALVLHVVSLHFANGEAFQLENRWINIAELPEVEHQDFSKTGPNEWLVSAMPYSEVEVSFSAEPADALANTYLGHKTRTPVFCIERAAWCQDTAITLVRLSHRRGYRLTTRC
ncbi:UTRA domain-containing protein [Falsirhodobacter sp. alg1]|uniref:UTRA domain-containing protein n=1 Tax=Falsirhodobacter sp. alg1 TaxID=1472418 RepID=UPI00069473BF|nr:UTRA domain-containing protein [Falsirhodobacter sp. alg1]